MFQTLVNFFKVADIRKKILFTLAMLVIFRIGTFVPVPGVNAAALQSSMDGGILGFLNTFNGGDFKKLLNFCHGCNALHYIFHYCSVTSNGRCS